MIKLSLTPAADNTLYGPLLFAYYYRQKLATEHINCALNIDPIGHQARTGLSASSSLQQIDAIVEHCASHYSNIRSLCADSSVYHNAGSTEAQELAFLLATTVDYLRVIKTVDIETAFKQLQFRLALDCDYFQSCYRHNHWYTLDRSIGHVGEYTAHQHTGGCSNGWRCKWIPL